MAQITLTIPDAQLPRVQAALTDAGVTPKEFLVGQLKAFVEAYELQQAQATAIANMQQPPAFNVT